MSFLLRLLILALLLQKVTNIDKIIAKFKDRGETWDPREDLKFCGHYCELSRGWSVACACNMHQNPRSANCRTFADFKNNIVSFRQVATTLHNELRQAVASGSNPTAHNLTGRAANMYTLNYHRALEYIAGCVAKKCLHQKSACLTTKTFNYPSQNLASTRRSDATAESHLRASIDLWYQEQFKLPNREAIDHFPGNSFTNIRNFTTMMWGTATHFGCAISEYKDAQEYLLLLACVYGTINRNLSAIINLKFEPVYMRGTPGSKCNEYIMNDKYDALCMQIYSVPNEPFIEGINLSFAPFNKYLSSILMYMLMVFLISTNIV